MVSVLHSLARLTDVDGGLFSVPGTVLGSQQSCKTENIFVLREPHVLERKKIHVSVGSKEEIRGRAL